MGSNTTEFKLVGMGELINNLESLPKEVLERAEKKILRNQLKKVLEDAMAKVPVKTGNAKSQFRIRIKNDRSKGELFGALINTANHSHLLEFGHMHIGHKPKKQIIGVVAAQPFMRPALAKNTEGMIRESQEEFESAFEKFARKQKRNGL